MLQTRSPQKPKHPGCAGSFKAAETGRLLPFCVHLLAKLGGSSTFGNPMMVAGRTLQTYMQTMKDSGVIVPKPQINAMLTALDLHLRACAAAGISYTPKHHVVCHMTLRRASFLFPFPFACIARCSRPCREDGAHDASSTRASAERLSALGHPNTATRKKTQVDHCLPNSSARRAWNDVSDSPSGYDTLQL